ADVAHLGNAAEDDRLTGQQRRRQSGQRGIFRSAGGNRARQWTPAFDDEFIHVVGCGSVPIVMGARLDKDAQEPFRAQVMVPSCVPNETVEFQNRSMLLYALTILLSAFLLS